MGTKDNRIRQDDVQYYTTKDNRIRQDDVKYYTTKDNRIRQDDVQYYNITILSQFDQDTAPACNYHIIIYSILRCFRILKDKPDINTGCGPNSITALSTLHCFG